MGDMAAVHYCGFLPIFSAEPDDLKHTASSDSAGAKTLGGVEGEHFAVMDHFSERTVEQRAGSASNALQSQMSDRFSPTTATRGSHTVRLLRTPTTVNPWQRLPEQPSGSLRLVIISDTHGAHDRLQLPPGDVLLHCGDCFQGIAPFRRDKKALIEFFAWLNAQPFAVKIFMGGNHDSILSKRGVEKVREMAAPALYLCDESAVLEPVGLRVYASPRSVPNTFISPNKAFQSHALPWDVSPVFSLPSAAAAGTQSTSPRAARSSSSTSPVECAPASVAQGTPLTVRLESKCEGPIDILLTHQGLEPRKENQREGKHNAALLQYLSVTQPRRLHCGGHAHGGHGMYWISARKGEAGMHVLKNLDKDSAQNDANRRKHPSHANTGPMVNDASVLLSLNAAIMLRNNLFGGTLQPPLVVDMAV